MRQPIAGLLLLALLARLLAAKGGRDANLETAIEFFREVGASGYLADAEALVTRSRSA